MHLVGYLIREKKGILLWLVAEPKCRSSDKKIACKELVSVPSDNLQYSLFWHLSGSMQVRLTEFYCISFPCTRTDMANTKACQSRWPWTCSSHLLSSWSIFMWWTVMLFLHQSSLTDFFKKNFVCLLVSCILVTCSLRHNLLRFITLTVVSYLYKTLMC